MSIPNGFKGRAKRLDDIDLPRLGEKIGVGEDDLHAFMDVEAAGSGFDKRGRPKMLFEPHIFYRHLTGAQRRTAINRGLAYKRWGTKKYPRDSYPRLLKAMNINQSAALKSASWGLGQVLGQNYKMLNYPDVQSMVAAFCDDEENHLKGIIDFLIANNIDDDLRNHNWAVVARVYNGPGYAKNKYHTRMAKAFRKWQKIKDTEWDRNAPQAPIPDYVPTIPNRRKTQQNQITGKAAGIAGAFALIAGAVVAGWDWVISFF